eukprot:PITA_27961
MNHLLEAKVTKNEVKATLFAMIPDKAPGPDGFSAKFLQICWSIVEKDLCKMVLKSQVCKKIGGITNSDFLALIPKEKGANSFNGFRLISLCNIGYKLITKVIVNKLMPILPKIIPDSQGSFIQGRQVVDNFILVQEAIHSSLSRNEKGMVVKLDLANAFDRVRHCFLLKVLHKLGFASEIIASRFKKDLDEFCLVSGSSLNKGKCHIYCWNTTSSLLNSISRIFGFAASPNWTSFKYLGLSVFLKKAYSRDWLPQLEKFKNKLLAWGYSWHNIAGKSVLIKSVLSSLPLFQFSVLLAPSSILKKMEETIRKLFWKGGKQNVKKIPLVN